MICEKCKGKMYWNIDGSVQGWRCLMCGWNVLTTHIDAINIDETEYSLYLENNKDVNLEKVKFVAKIANVNYVIAKRMLEENACVIKTKAVKIKTIIAGMQELEIDFRVIPSFKW